MVVLPPFDIIETIPADNGVVSQHPIGARTFRDTVESWLLINHNVQGRHDKVQLDWRADPGAGVASVTELWASNTGSAAGGMKFREGTGNVAWMLPPGMIVAYAVDAAPEGWLLCAGQQVSRSTYARLFAVLSTTWGTGDGTTTFNVPDLRGRVIAGQDDMNGVSASRLTGLTNGVNGNNFAAAGGLQSTTLTSTELPAHTHSITDPGHGHPGSTAPNQSAGAGFTVAGGGSTQVGGSQLITIATGSTGITATNSTGSGAAFNNVQPTLIMNYIIKT